jgi:DNA-binding IclR family transcriptional regulator
MPYRADGTGYRHTDTSHAAAVDMAGKVITLRAQVLEVLRRHPDGLDSEQIAQLLGREYGSIQPRTAELRNDGLIVDSGRRHESRFGKRIIVWRHRDHQKPHQMEMPL